MFVKELCDEVSWLEKVKRNRTHLKFDWPDVHQGLFSSFKKLKTITLVFEIYDFIFGASNLW